jgi:CheY-like chemotaxis protein
MDQPTSIPQADEKTVLIVDDEASMRTLLRAALESLDIPCRIYEATSGEKALEFAKETRFNLVLLDIILPGSTASGVMVCRELCKDLHSRVVIVSGSASKSIMEACLAMGAKDIIHKPFTLESLQTSLRQLLTA